MTQKYKVGDRIVMINSNPVAGWPQGEPCLGTIHTITKFTAPNVIGIAYKRDPLFTWSIIDTDVALAPVDERELEHARIESLRASTEEYNALASLGESR